MNGKPNLEELKRKYCQNVDKSSSVVKGSCKHIANLIQADTERCSQDLEYNFVKKFCVLYYCDKGNIETIKGIANITKGKQDNVYSIYIDNVSGFDKGGSILLKEIIKEALKNCCYNYVYLNAAGDGNGKIEDSASKATHEDNDNNSEQKKLIEYYLNICNDLSDICAIQVGYNVYYYRSGNEEFLPEH